MIKKICIFLNLVFALLSSYAFAQVEVQSVYDSRSRTPNRLIPFRIAAEKGVANVQEVQLEVEDNADCRSMIDPYRDNIIWLKCLTETQVNLSIRAINEKTVYDIKYGPIVIANPGDSLVVIRPENTLDENKILAGKQLFNARCVGCHNPPKLKAGRNVDQLKASVLMVETMRSLDSVLSTQDYETLAAYLGSL